MRRGVCRSERWRQSCRPTRAVTVWAERTPVSCCGATAGRARGRALVVFVDDAHLLDSGSATLVHQLALTRTATVLVTVRSGEATPDPVVALWRDGPAERIEVAVLNDPAIEELVVSVLGGPVDAASLRQLADHCRGNPMVLRELV